MESFPKISVSGEHPTLLVVAAPVEVKAVLGGLGVSDASTPPLWQTGRLSGRISLLHCGVGKANAAGALAHALSGPECYGSVVNLGIGGALPDEHARTLKLGHAVVATTSVFADEGMVSAAGYQSLAEMGFPLEPTGTGSFPGDPGLRARFRTLVDGEGPVACVSTCSGTDALAREVVRRTGARVECMEGAALALVCARLQVPFCEVRTISNFTGDRASQQWNIPLALQRLSSIVRAVFAPEAR